VSALPGTTGRRRIYLMRHGHVDYFKAAEHGGTDFVPLSERGREEATAAGIALSHVPFDRVLNSGLRRTVETARHVLDEHESSKGMGPALEAVSEPRLREIHGGGANFTSFEDLIARITFAFEQAGEPGARMAGDGEVFAQAYDRAVAGIEALLRTPGWGQALVVAHEGINRLLLGWASGGGLAAVKAFEQDTACINILDADMTPPDNPDTDEQAKIERVIIKAVNLTPYNYAKHGMNKTSLEAIFTPTS